MKKLIIGVLTGITVLVIWKLVTTYWWKEEFKPSQVTSESIKQTIHQEANQSEVRVSQGSSITIEGDVQVEGDFVGGDKYEFNVSNPSAYKPLDGQIAQRIVARVSSLKSAYTGTQVKILFQIFNANNETNRFAHEFKKIMEESGISARIVPIMVVGLPPKEFPLNFRYNKIGNDVVMDLIRSIDEIFSAQNGQIRIPKPVQANNIAEGYTLLIQMWENVHFDDGGRVFFSKN